MRFYLCWVTWYGFVNFVLAADTIKKKNYDSTYVHFGKKAFVKKLLDKFPRFMHGVVFCFGHFLFWFTFHIVAIVQYHFFWLNTAAIIGWGVISVWNGACYYMDWFAKKYEAQLQKLKALEDELKEE